MAHTGGNDGGDIDESADGVIEEAVEGEIREDGGNRSDEEGEGEAHAETEEADIGRLPGAVATEAVFSLAQTPSRIYLLIHALLRMTLAWRREPKMGQQWYLAFPFGGQLIPVGRCKYAHFDGT